MSAAEIKYVSIIIPCRNEEKYMMGVLETVAAQDYPQDKMEVLIVDGMSTDATPEIVRNFKHKRLKIVLVENPERTVPYAMNRGLKMAHGEIVVRLDAHTVIPADYVSVLVKSLQELEAENVGGVLETLPANNSIKARAIAAACSSSIGMGNSHFRIGTHEIKQVDTVPFGCFRRDLFDRIGFFDTDLTRNQDDEFNARLIKNGGKIFLLPQLRMKYFARENYVKLWRMFFQYGLFKPLVGIKVGRPATLRQFAPPVFVLTTLLSWILAVIWPMFSWYALGQILVYEMAVLVSAVAFLSRKNEWLLIPAFVTSIHLIHFAYGLGYLKGIWVFLISRRSPSPNNIRMSR